MKLINAFSIGTGGGGVPPPLPGVGTGIRSFVHAERLNKIEKKMLAAFVILLVMTKNFVCINFGFMINTLCEEKSVGWRNGH